MSKKRPMLAESVEDKHDKLSCIIVEDKKIFGGGDIPLELGRINMKKGIPAGSFVWLFSVFNMVSPLIINSQRFHHPMLFGRIGSRQLGEGDGFNCGIKGFIRRWGPV
jgi:hypothetical protein